MADEINAMHKADHARDLFLEAYGLLGHPAKRTDDDTNAVYTTDDGGKF